MTTMSKVISFDIWDTIIKRNCHPEEIKLKTANYIVLKYNDGLKDKYKDIYEILKLRDTIEADLCKKAEDEGHDGECRIEDVFENLISDIFDGKTKLNASELLEVELQNEKDAIFINPDILPIFDKYKDLDMYCVSDFYMDSKSLKELLDFLKLPVNIKKIYSSADLLLNKRTGNLFKKFEEDLKIKPEDHIHVGDNPYSDIEMANSLGITTIKVKKTEFSFSPSRNRRMRFDLKTALKDNSTEENRIYNAGLELAPLLYFFIYSIIENGIKNNLDKIYYQTREGETFIKVHELINNNNPFGVDIPDGEIMEVSRMATFGASLDEFSINSLLRLWSQYKNQSMKSLFKTLNIDPAPFKKYFGKYDIVFDEDIVEPWFDLRVQKLFNDKSFTTQVESLLKIKREKLLEYFEKKLNIKNDDKPIFVVDIGWRGTIQDNLAYIFDKKQIGGYYMTLYDFYNLQPSNTYKLSFIDDKKIRDKEVANIITLLEWIYNPGTGSVIEYEQGEAIRKAKSKEISVVKHYIKPLQEGMFAGCEIINAYMKNHPYEASETKNVVYDLIKNIKKNPSKELIDAYYSMVFNDTFGSAEYIEKDNKLSFIQKMNIFKCRNILRKEDWKEAFMIYNNLQYMKILLNVKGSIRKVIKRK